MSASEFSNVIPTLETWSKETLDKNNFKDMKLLKSIHDESFDIANEFFSSKVDDEGFEDDDDEDDQIEGMKSRKRKGKGKGKSYKSKFDLIGWALRKTKISKNDINLVKNILHTLFVTFLSLLIAHNWYYTFFTNPTDSRLENTLSFLTENEFIHFFTIYIVQIVKSIDEFIMTSIPEKINLLMALSSIGRRSIFYFILSVSLGAVPYFLKQIKSILLYFEKQVFLLIDLTKDYKNSPRRLGKFFRDIISKAFNSIFLFKGNPILSSLIGITYIMKFMENLVIDHSKGIIENATEVIPSFFTKLLAGSIFYIIYIIFKFAMFYQPTVAFSSFIITAYLFYFSIVRLPKLNGLDGSFATVSANIEHMNDGKVLFRNELIPGWKTNLEDVSKFIMDNAHQIFMFSALSSNFKHLFKIDSAFLKITLAIGGTIGVAGLMFSILQKYGIGNAEKQKLNEQIVSLTAEIKKKIETPASNDESYDMIENMYKQFETKI
jgi:hypothetical protein